MPASRAQRAATADRRAKAVQLRLAGLDFQAIADRLGYADRAAAHKDITRALEANVAEMNRNVEVHRQEELDRLFRLQLGVWPAAAAGDPKAVQTVLNIIDRRCKLLGLDAPQRVEVVTLDAIDNEIRRLNAELGGNQAGEAARTAPPA